MRWFILCLLLIACDASLETEGIVQLNNKTFNVAVADTPEERTKGLQGRLTLPEDHGMWFIFEDPGPRAFWMKDTYLVLDIIYLDENQTVVDYFLSAAPCTAEPCPQYVTGEKVQYVLEVQSGAVNVSAGMQARFKHI